MDKTQDVILGVLGTQWERSRPFGVSCYLESIKRIGYTGRKVMLCWDIHPETRTSLLQYGFEIVDLPVPAEAFFHARVRVVYEYLRDHHKEFRWVHWLDVKDLVLQSDPSVWIDENAGMHGIIASTESVSIKNEETNWMWSNSILGAVRANEIANCEVFNGGTFSGKSEIMHEFFHQVHLLCQQYKGGFPPCQISMAYAANTMFKDDLYTPRMREGFAACLHPFWSPWRMPCWSHLRDPHPVLDVNRCVLHAGTVPNGSNKMIVFNPTWGDMSYRRIRIVAPSNPLSGLELLTNPEGKAFSVVHGYDRDWDIKLLFEYKYQVGRDFNMEAFTKELEQRIPSERRGLRAVKRLHVENLAFGGDVSPTTRTLKRR